MSKALDLLSQKIAIRKANADNENYDIGLTIAEGMAVLAEFKQLRTWLEKIKWQIDLSNGQTAYSMCEQALNGEEAN